MWYSAKLLYRSQINGRASKNPLEEESIRIFVATDEEAAQQKSADIGKINEHSYRNEGGELVEWKFVRVLEIQDLCESEIYDGIEVFSSLFRSRRHADPGGS